MSGLLMPKPDDATMRRRAEIVADMRIIVPGEGVVDAANEMRAFESDGLTAYRQLPLVVVLPETVAQVSRVLQYCNDRNIRVVPRGSGTSLSGGALPLEDAVLLVMSRFNRILEIDYPNRVVVVQPGVTNLGITNAVEQEGFYYAPDPSSQIACSIGGNVAENSGGVHCLKYGLTANNVLGIEMVLINGEVVRLGGKHLDAEGYDLLGVMTGSEGLLGVVTEVTVRILRKPETARALLIGFPTSEQAGQCVADIIGAGIIPGGMEMMDRPAIHAAEDFVHAGYPLDVEALLIVELDGPGVEVDHLIGAGRGDRRTGTARPPAASRNRSRSGCRSGPAARRPFRRSAASRRTITAWTAPSRARSCRACSPACASCRSNMGSRVANVFHAGDGNLHPLILYDANKPGELEQAEKFRRRHPAALRRGRRRADRRARRRRREARPDAGNVQRGRPRPAEAGQMRLRPQASAQPRKGVPAAAPLRRARPHACASRAGGVSGYSEVLR